MNRFAPLACVLYALPLVAQSTVVASRSFQNSLVCYDGARQRLVAALTDRSLWEWDGRDWGRTSASLPVAVNAAVYDPHRQRVFFLAAGDLLAFDGHAVTSAGPTPSFFRLLAAPGQGLLVGLQNRNSQTSALQVWDGVAWQARPGLPTGSVFVTAAYDEHRQCLVAQAIQTVPYFAFTTWEWDGATWALRSTDTNFRVHLGYDAVRQQVLGYNTSTWAWDGSRWNQLPVSFTPPNSVRPVGTIGGRMWCFDNTPGDPGRFYAFDGQDWTRPLAVAHPPLLPQPAFSFDAHRGRAMLTGADTTLASFQHWEWDGFAWTSVLSANGPSPRSGHVQVYDAARRETVVFGGADNTTEYAETWAWNGATWRLAASTGPARRSAAAAAYDADRQLVVLVGGISRNTGVASDHWEWDGSTWTPVAATTPMGAVFGAMGHDARRHRVVFLDQLRRTFELVAGAWVQVPTPSPLLLHGGSQMQALTYDPAQQQLLAVLYGDDLYVHRFGFDGATWSVVGPGIGDLAHDPARDLLLDFNGTELQVLARTPAGVDDVGTPCGGTTTATSLTAFRRPCPGDAAFHLDLRAEAAFRPALLGIAATIAPQPLGHGCTLLLQDTLGSLLWFTDAVGCAHIPLPLPRDPALHGLQCVAQAGVIDPATPGGLALSQGLRLALGD